MRNIITKGRIHIKPHITKTKIIPNMGLSRDDDIGDLIIIFEVVYPKQFSEEQIQELEKIL